MAEKIVVSQLPAAESLEGLYVLGVNGENGSVKASIALLKGNVGEKGDDGTSGAPGKAPRINAETNMWETWDNDTSTWVSTGVDASSDYVLTTEKVEAVGVLPVNEIRYAAPLAGNVFGAKYLKC
ncbi:MAG: hypothetical protein LBS55_06480, partial [Prevotellaceae bacterium]|nr:hypothetical protein [Prevotellaceae bacterium]